jgi:hypothetical protein
MAESVSALMTGGRGIPCATLMQFFMPFPEVPEEAKPWEVAAALIIDTRGRFLYSRHTFPGEDRPGWRSSRGR